MSELSTLTLAVDTSVPVRRGSDHIAYTSENQPTTVLVAGLSVAIHGGTTDIYKVDFTGSSLVIVPLAIKVPRAMPEVPQSARAQVMSAVLDAYARLQSTTTLTLDHDSVCPSWVVNTSTRAGAPVYALATPWFENGNILQYTRRHPTAEKCLWVVQVASGLEHLHAQGLVHGNICPSNILISDDLSARITDVGLDLLMRQIYLDEDGRLPVPTQWMFKSKDELTPPENTADVFKFEHTMPMDVYSFACTVYTIYTGRILFSSRQFPYSRGLIEILHHGHSSILQPVEISDNMWTLLKRCLNINPSERPTMREVVTGLKALS